MIFCAVSSPDEGRVWRRETGREEATASKCCFMLHVCLCVGIDFRLAYIHDLYWVCFFLCYVLSPYSRANPLLCNMKPNFYTFIKCVLYLLFGVYNGCLMLLIESLRPIYV
jgi:hypothetical protein